MKGRILIILAIASLSFTQSDSISNCGSIYVSFPKIQDPNIVGLAIGIWNTDNEFATNLEEGFSYKLHLLDFECFSVEGLAPGYYYMAVNGISKTDTSLYYISDSPISVNMDSIDFSNVRKSPVHTVEVQDTAGKYYFPICASKSILKALPIKGIRVSEDSISITKIEWEKPSCQLGDLQVKPPAFKVWEEFIISNKNHEFKCSIIFDNSMMNK